MILRLVICAATAVFAYFAVINAIPGFIMGVALKRFEEGGARNAFAHPPATTPASREVVKPSPDLLYSACAFDLSEGAIRITVAPWEDYVSLSLFADNTDNFFAMNDTDAGGEPIDLILVAENADAPEVSGDVEVVRSPSKVGLALVRRLTPTKAAIERADEARQNDVCAVF